MASVKLFNDRLWNDMTQVAGALPTLFIGGQADAITEPSNYLEYALSYLSLAGTIAFDDATT